MNRFRGPMPTPSLRDIADHEASHAVIWWWLAQQPENLTGIADGWIDKVTIDPEGVRLGQTLPGKTVFSPKDRYRCQILVCFALAGPVSDEFRGREDTHQVLDEGCARHWASQFMDQSEVNGYLSDARDTVRKLLKDPEVRTRVRRLADALLDRTTIEGPEVLTILD
jgi:hypothetical protein